MYSKDFQIPFFGKNLSNKLIGGIKGLATVLDEPVVQGGLSLISPALGASLGAVKKIGLLEKLKH